MESWTSKYHQSTISAFVDSSVSRPDELSHMQAFERRRDWRIKRYEATRIIYAAGHDSHWRLECF